MSTTETTIRDIVRWLYRCPGCKAMARRNMIRERQQQGGGFYPRWNTFYFHVGGTRYYGNMAADTVRCTCGREMNKREVTGKLHPGVPCNARCTGANGADCECSCAGANHGSAHREA